jgi:hypothetical protein
VSFFFISAKGPHCWMESDKIYPKIPWARTGLSQISVGSPQRESTSHPHRTWLGDSWGTEYNLFWCISCIHWYCGEFCGNVFRQR